MGTLFVDKLDPQSGTSLEIGSSGDTITIPSGCTITNNGTQTGFGGNNKPLVSVYASADTSLSDNAFTKVPFNTENFDADNTFDNLFNTPARDGVFSTDGFDATGNETLHDGLRTSKNRNFGYRLHLRTKVDGTAGVGEVITIRNCCITAHTKTLDANNAQEETIEFYSYVQPVISNDGSISQATDATSADDI